MCRQWWLWQRVWAGHGGETSYRPGLDSEKKACSDLAAQMSTQSHLSVCKPLRWELVNRRVQEARLLCVVPCSFPRRVAGTSSPLCPRLPRDWHCGAAPQLRGGFGTESPSERSFPHGPAARTAGSRLLQPQEPAHSVLKQQAVLLGDACPSSGV